MDDEDGVYERKLQAIMVVILVVLVAIVSFYLYEVLTFEENVDLIEITSPGNDAKLYLQDNEFTELLVEVDYIKGRMPDNSTLDMLVDMLGTYCDKSSIYYSLSDVINETAVDEIYDIETILNLEKEYRDHKNSGDVAVIYIIFLNGGYSESDQTLGLSYLASSFAIFKDKIDAIEIPFAFRRFVQPVDFEHSVVIHEAGHLLGLVNINYESTDDHEDIDSEHHCVFEDCVMFHALEHSRQSYMDKIWQREDLKPPTELCEYCVEDLDKLKRNIY
jgi:hypothetical protein